MPRYMEVKAPDDSTYKLSSFDDEIEPVHPGLWYGAFKMYYLQYFCKIPEDQAREMAWASLREWANKPCPEYLIRLYTTNKKKNQESLLRGKTMTSADLISWILYSGRLNGKFSQYAYDGGAGELSDRAPILIDASDQEHIIAVGKTDLSDEALMYIVEHQKKVLSQFITFEDGRWFCFYRTFMGLSGRENGNQGQHIHFISYSYGLEKERLVDDFKQGVCPKNGFHIRFENYWKNTK